MTGAADIDMGWEAVKSLIAKFIQAVLGFAGVIIFTRTVGKGEFGGFYLLFSLVTIASRPVQGFASSVEKRWSEGMDKNEMMGTVLSLNTLALILIMIVVIPLSPLLEDYTGLSGAGHLFILLFGAIVLFTMIQNILGAEGYPARKVWNDTLRSIITLPLQILFVLSGFGALGMGYGLSGATLLVIPIGMYMVWERPRLPSIDTIKSLWGYARYSIPGSIVGKIYNEMDIILLGILAGTTSVADYQVALKLTVPAGFMSIAIGSALFPKISSKISNDQDFTEDVTNAVSYISIIAIPIFFGAIAIPDELVVTAFSGKYSGAGPYLAGLALYMIFSTQSTAYRRVLNGMNLPNINFRIGTYTLLLNVILGVGLFLTIGPIGVVIATVIAELLQYALSLRAVTDRVNGVNPFPRVLQMQLVSGLIMFIVVVLVNRFVGVQSWIDLLVVVGTGGLVYGIVLFGISSGLRVTAKSIYRDAITGE